MKRLTISLSLFDFLQERLEPSKARSIPAHPNELDTSQSTKLSPLLAVPDVLEDTREWRNTDTGTDQDSHFGVEDILGRGTVWTVDPDAGESGAGVGEFDEVTALAKFVLIFLLLRAFQSVRGDSSDNIRTSTEALSESTGPVTDLTNVN